MIPEPTVIAEEELPPPPIDEETELTEVPLRLSETVPMRASGVSRQRSSSHICGVASASTTYLYTG